MTRPLASSIGQKFATGRSTMRKPCRANSRSRITLGLSRLTVYEATELRNPGWNSSVTAAPPTTAFFSMTTTRSPAPAR